MSESLGCLTAGLSQNANRCDNAMLTTNQSTSLQTSTISENFFFNLAVLVSCSVLRFRLLVWLTVERFQTLLDQLTLFTRIQLRELYEITLWLINYNLFLFLFLQLKFIYSNLNGSFYF